MNEFSYLEIKTGRTLLPFHPFGQALSLIKSKAVLTAKLVPKILPSHSVIIFLKQEEKKKIKHMSQGVFPNPRTIEVYHVIPISVKLFLSMQPLNLHNQASHCTRNIEPFYSYK